MGLYESRGGRPGLPVPNGPYGLRECKVTLEEKEDEFRAQELYESRDGCLGSPSLIA